MTGAWHVTEPHRFTVRVYYEDTDFSGSIYHAAYLKFCERARTEMLRAAGVHHAELAGQGIAFAVTEMQLRFLAAGRIDNELAVVTESLGATGARLRLSQKVFRGETLLCDVTLTVVAIRIGGGATRLPRQLVAHFA
ncbi:acyl-CoA thioester hydrolase [Devosia enhydra]|uniref:Acyl-CoA thioester hydrolase n=1 Tax=Devosia enhydra TaxID=665118 RepID=A0A1K2HWT4_9HYPH|nr:acyl-CoA thioester hydrolase [Devosia enhydra]